LVGYQGVYYPWDQLVEQVKTKLRNTRIKVDVDTGDVKIKIGRDDLEYLETIFFPAADGSITFWLQIAARVPGSAIAGAITDIGSLVTAEFSVTIVNKDAKETCTGNIVYLGDQSETNPPISRKNVLNYQIPSKADTNAQPFYIVARETFSTKEKTDCKVHTWPQYFHPLENEWKDAKESNHLTMSMVDGDKWVALNYDQEYFLNHLIPEYGNADIGVDGTVIIMGRFMHEDPASGYTLADEVTILVTGSGETLSAYCEYSGLYVDGTQESFAYDIPFPSPHPGHRVQHEYTPRLMGQETVASTCMGLVTESLEYVFEDGTVDVWWHTGKKINDEENSDIYLVDEFEPTTQELKKRHVRLAVTQEDFGQYLQPRLQSLDQSVWVPVRHTWRDEYHNIVLEKYFWVNVIGNGALSKCQQEIVQKDTQTSDISLAFDANTEGGRVRHISIPRTLETIAVIEECNAVFKMMIWDSQTYTYLVWDQLASSLQSELNGTLLSTVDFDYKTGDFEATFYLDDFEYIRDRFVDADGSANMWI
jgi:hypothetical protein